MNFLTNKPLDEKWSIMFFFELQTGIFMNYVVCVAAGESIIADSSMW